MATIPCGFNERLYEFCVNFELVSSLNALIAGYIPGIPSPRNEAELGWDARLPMPKFGQTFLLQYKVARRTTARYGANARFWDVHGDEYCRFTLHRDRDGSYTQHELLLDASAPNVQAVYCAPLIQRQGDLVEAVRIGGVIAQSALIDVANLGPVAPGIPHSVTYPVDEATGPPCIHSDPKPGKRLHWEELRRPPQDKVRELDEAAFDALSAKVLAGKERREKRRRHRERRIWAEDKRAAAYLRASAIALDELGAVLAVFPATAT